MVVTEWSISLHGETLLCSVSMLSRRSELRRQLEEIAEQKSVAAQQSQRELELSRRHLANAQQQLQFKADIIHQLTGCLQVYPLPPFSSIITTAFLSSRARNSHNSQQGPQGPHLSTHWQLYYYTWLLHTYPRCSCCMHTGS